jgi:CBS domain-containing protein
MDIELVEIRDFLASHPPFDHLPADALDKLPKELSIRYFRRGSEFPPRDTDQAYLYLIRQGAIELRDADGELVSKLGEGDMCTFPCTHDSFEPPFNGSTAEDTLVYLLDCQQLQAVKAANDDFREHFDNSVSQRLRKALQHMQHPAGQTGSNLMTMDTGELTSNRVVSAPPDASIQEVARIMSDERVSSLLIMENNKLLGMVTLRDLRSRCLAVGLPYDRPVREIMTENLHLIDHNTPAFQGLIAMTRLNVHHLPVVNGEQVVGVLTTTDLVRHQSANAIYLVGDVYKAKKVETLAQIGQRIPELQVHLVASGATADHVGQAVTAVTSAITRRLLQMAEEQLGAPPVPYAWVACGSQARREQTSHGDQDNALIISNEMEPAHDAYFAAMAKIVCDGLNACGYYYCPGDVMATNPRWRQPLRVWKRYFSNWIDKPEPMALMLSSVFFDMRAIGGDESLMQRLQSLVLEKSRNNKIFLAYMVANALKHRPPLGFFRNFVLISGGDHAKTFDLKHRGIVPITDLARVFSLSEGLDEINTVHRLEEASKTTAISRDGGANLVDAFEFIATLRVQHQVRQIKAGQQPDNYISPSELSPLERGHLKDAFSLIASIQETLGQRYQAGRFG